MGSARMRRFGLPGVLALVCASGLVLLSPGAASAKWATTGGAIGIVDSAPAVPNAQAPLVTPGGVGQALADVQLAIPNTFKPGDSINLALFDRSAGAAAGKANTDAAHKLTFSSTPTFSVAGPYKGAFVPDTSATKATTAPSFTLAPTASATRAHGQGNDVVTMTSTPTSGGDTSDFWVVTVTGLKVDVGAAVSPGEIRVVPFAIDKGTSLGPIPITPDKPSDLFYGNVDGAAPTIKGYTVAGYVAPAKFETPTTSIVSDGSVQSVGDLVVTELAPTGLQPAATYTVHVTGATIRNDAANPVTVTMSTAHTDGPATQSATVNPANGTITFTLTAGDPVQTNGSLVSINLHGLLLSSTTSTSIGYQFSGGSVSDFLSAAGASPAIPGAGLAPDTTFGSAAVVHQANIVAPALTGSGVALVEGTRIGGSNRYATAARIAVTNGPDASKAAVLASGEDYPDALSAAFLAQRLGPHVSVLLTKRDSLPDVTASALAQVGVTNLYLVGGTGAIGPVAEASATAALPAGSSVTRLAGANRYGTNKAVNTYAANIGGTPIGKTNVSFGVARETTALLATGEDFADALSAGPATAGAAGDNPIPLILTRGASLSADAASQLSSLGIQQVVVVGGEGVVSASVASQLTASGIAVKRVFGANRYETSTAMADFEVAPTSPASATVDGGLGFDPAGSTTETAYLATGASYADALAGAALAADHNASASPILLTTSTALQPAVQTWLSKHAGSYSSAVALGLAGAVSDAVLNAAQAAIL